MIRGSGFNNTKNPPGQIVNHLGENTMGEVKLGDIIDKVIRSELLPVQTASVPSVSDRLRRMRGQYLGDGVNPGVTVSELLEEFTKVYQEGYIDGKAEGFKEGLVWARGK